MDENIQFKEQFDFLSTHTPEYEFTVPYIVEHVVNRLGQHAHFMDIGAGRGNLCKPLSAYFEQTTIVEPNKIYFDELHAWGQKKQIVLDGFNSDWLKVNTDKCADLILMSHVMYYVPAEYWLYFFYKAYELLNPNGRIVIILNSLTNDITRLYKEFLLPHEWWEIASAEAVGAMLRREGYVVDGMKFHSTIYADTPDTIAQLIDFLLLGRAKFDNAAIIEKRRSYAEKHFKRDEGYLIRADAGLMIITKEDSHAG